MTLIMFSILQGNEAAAYQDYRSIIQAAIFVGKKKRKEKKDHIPN